MSKPLVGVILDDDVIYNRDAIHIPIIPVYACEELNPADKITIKKYSDGSYYASKSNTPVGIVDPYLKNTVKVGQQFYCHIKPGKIKKLWHQWTHPSFDE